MPVTDPGQHLRQAPMPGALRAMLDGASIDDDHAHAAQFRYRAIFISDTHLGTLGCRADALLDFLRRTDSEYLYLVGDIVDGWQLKRRWYWHQSHNDVVQKLLRKASKAAFPVTGPIDVVRDPSVGVLASDLRSAALAALALDRERVRARAPILVARGDRSVRRESRRAAAMRGAQLRRGLTSSPSRR